MVRLLDERLHPRGAAGRARHPTAGANVAVPGLGAAGTESQRDERARPLRDVERDAEVGAEAGVVVDRVIGGQHRDRRIVALSHDGERRERDRCRGVASLGLDQHLTGAQPGQLRAHRPRVLAPGHDPHAFSSDQRRETGDRLLQHRPRADDR